MTGQESGEVVLTQDLERIRIVTMHRQDRLNAFNLDMIVSLSRHDRIALPGAGGGGEPTMAFTLLC